MGSIPIAAALMLKGLTPGAALVFLIAGPAVSIANMIVIGKTMGRRQLVLYLLSIVSGALLGGIILDCFLPASWFVLPITDIVCHHIESPSMWDILCSIVFLLLLCNAFVLKYKKNKIMLKLTYQYVFNEHFFLQPDFQYIINPAAGEDTYKSPLFMALRVGIDF